MRLFRHHGVCALPPEVLQVSLLIGQQRRDVGGELRRRREVADVDDGVRRRVALVSSSAEHDRHDVQFEDVEHLLGDVVCAEVVLERDVEVVLPLEHLVAMRVHPVIGRGVCGAAQRATLAVHVDDDVLLQPRHVLLPAAVTAAVTDEPGDRLPRRDEGRGGRGGRRRHGSGARHHSSVQQRDVGVATVRHRPVEERAELRQVVPLMVRVFHEEEDVALVSWPPVRIARRRAHVTHVEEDSVGGRHERLVARREAGGHATPGSDERLLAEAELEVSVRVVRRPVDDQFAAGERGACRTVVSRTGGGGGVRGRGARIADVIRR